MVTATRAFLHAKIIGLGAPCGGSSGWTARSSGCGRRICRMRRRPRISRRRTGGWMRPARRAGAPRTAAATLASHAHRARRAGGTAAGRHGVRRARDGPGAASLRDVLRSVRAARHELRAGAGGARRRRAGLLHGGARSGAQRAAGPLLKPVCYMEHGYSPATMRRGVALARLLGEPNPFPLIRIPWDRDQPWQAVFLHEVAHNVQSDLGIWQENSVRCSNACSSSAARRC